MTKLYNQRFLRYGRNKFRPTFVNDRKMFDLYDNYSNKNLNLQHHLKSDHKKRNRPFFLKYRQFSQN